MEIIRIPRVMQDFALKEKRRGRTVGLVPTMGALHAGHLNIVRSCRGENDITVSSIFVNPLQFGRGEDFQSYPRDHEGDAEKLKNEGVDILFMPDAEALYPPGFSTRVSAGEIAGKLCGGFRPGHFDGVATVVIKLFNVVSPDRAYFGEKDYQQTLVIRRLVRDMNIPLEVVICPTVREKDGLAMSSRNSYLKEAERKAASAIYCALKRAAQRVAEGARRTSEIRSEMQGVLGAEPLITEIQYASAYDPETLEELQEIDGDALLAAAVFIGKTRLIDNVSIKAGGRRRD